MNTNTNAATTTQVGDTPIVGPTVMKRLKPKKARAAGKPKKGGRGKVKKDRLSCLLVPGLGLPLYEHGVLAGARQQFELTCR